MESASAGLGNAEERAARRRADEELAERIERAGIEAFVDHWEALPLFATHARLAAPARDDLRRRRLACSPCGLAASLRAVGTGSQPWLGDRLAELALPVSIVVGALDEKFRAIGDWMAARMRNARLEIVPEAGHAPHLEQPERYREIVERFFGVSFPEGGRSCRFDGKRFMSTRTSRSSRAEGIARITINRPEVRNAFRPQTVIELIDAFHRAREDARGRRRRSSRAKATRPSAPAAISACAAKRATSAATACRG